MAIGAHFGVEFSRRCLSSSMAAVLLPPPGLTKPIIPMTAFTPIVIQAKKLGLAAGLSGIVVGAEAIGAGSGERRATSRS